jgi:hypothetical protein
LSHAEGEGRRFLPAWRLGLRAAILMTQSAERAPGGNCDADTECLRAPCFQVQLDDARPRQAYRQASACSYHVPEVIEALRAWAREHGVADGRLTILAIEPAAGGRQAAQPGGPGQAGSRGFAFSTIPLGTEE